MVDISTLDKDIYNVLKNGVAPGVGVAPLIVDFGSEVGGSLLKHCTSSSKGYTKGKLYAGDIGKPCDREAWYKYNGYPRETLTGANKMKFAYGDVIESMVLTLAELAGHKVEHKQRRVEIALGWTGWTLSGRIDAVIDGVLVDVKSVTTQSLTKFKNGLKDDPFGYKMQLGTYSALIPAYDQKGFLTVDKGLGNVNFWDCSTITPSPSEVIDRAINLIKVLEAPVTPVHPDWATVEDGANKKLCTTCSYCSYKQQCWEKANGGKGLRTFLYANNRPVHLVDIKNMPRVPEVTLAMASTLEYE